MFVFLVLYRPSRPCTLQPNFSIPPGPSDHPFALIRRYPKYPSLPYRTIAGWVFPSVDFLLDFWSGHFLCDFPSTAKHGQSTPIVLLLGTIRYLAYAMITFLDLYRISILYEYRLYIRHRFKLFEDIDMIRIIFVIVFIAVKLLTLKCTTVLHA